MSLPAKTYEPTSPSAALKIVVWSLWAYTVVPNTFSLFAYGVKISASANTISGRLITQNSITHAFGATALALLAFFLIPTLLTIPRRGRFPKVRIVGLISIIVGVLLSLSHGIPPDIEAVLTIVVFIGLASANDCASLARTIAGTTLATAILSLLLAIEGSGWSIDWQWGESKAMIGTYALAGPFSHPNNLGIVLAIGIPLYGAFQDWRTRFAATALSLFTIVLTASRTALICGIIGLVISSITRQNTSYANSRRIVLGISSTIVAITAIVLPFIGVPDSFITGRGKIWRVSISQLGPIFGLGRNALGQNTIISHWLGFTPSTAHNTFLTAFVEYGVPGAVFTAIILVLCVTATWLRQTPAFLKGYAFVFLMLSVVETLPVFSIQNYWCLFVPTVWLVTSSTSVRRDRIRIHQPLVENCSQRDPNSKGGYIVHRRASPGRPAERRETHLA